MYISITDPCIFCVNNVNQKEQKKKGGGGASEIRQTWGGACPKRLKTPGVAYRTRLRDHLKAFAGVLS